MAVGPPALALPFWLGDVSVGEWAGSLALYEVLAAPLLLGLVAVMVYRKSRWFRARTYFLALAAASALGVATWYLGLGLHRGTLLTPDPLTVELMGIALGVQLAAVIGALLVIVGVRRMREADEAG